MSNPTTEALAAALAVKTDREMTDLLPLYRQMADSGVQFRGLSVLQHAKGIGKLAREIDAKTMLDYGCGAGDAYKSPNKLHHQLGISRGNVTLYDPSFKQHNNPPKGKFDLVVCSDVLEHIPEDRVDDFIANLFRHARLGVWASVCCRPAKKTFPGTEINLHVTVKPFDWWVSKFAVLSRAVSIGETGTEDAYAYHLVETE